MTVRLIEIVDGLVMGDPWRVFYDRQAGRLVSVIDDELAVAEESAVGEDPAALAARTEYRDAERVELALRIVEAEAGAFVPLPTSWDVHMHALMEDFVSTLPESEMRRRLWDGLHRSGAFRRFHDGIRRYDIADAWYRYRDERLAQIARRWADDFVIPLAD